MSLTTLINRPMTLIRRASTGSVDTYGNDVDGETTVAVLGELQQIQRTEPVAEGELSDTRWLLFLPAGTAIDTGDAVICDGEVFEVVGAPWPARNPRTGAQNHVEVTLRQTIREETP